jgi:peroxiredoxin
MKGFEILGKVSGLPDSTMIYLYQSKIHLAERIDSAFVIDNQFHFKGSIQDDALQVVLQTKDGRNYKYFWLENAVINFTAENGRLNDAIITGSETQEEQEKLDILVGSDKQKTISYIRNNSASMISAYLLSIYAPTWGRDTSASLYTLLSEKMKATYFGKSVSAFIKLNKNVGLGDKYSDFGQADSSGTIIHLSDFKGKVVLLDFWGSWCGPCRANNPKLVMLYNEFKSKGFEVFGVAADYNKKSWIAAIKKDGLNWTNVTDLKGMENKAAMIYGVHKYPTTYLINKQGIIVGIDLEGDELRRKLIESLD